MPDPFHRLAEPLKAVDDNMRFSFDVIALMDMFDHGDGEQPHQAAVIKKDSWLAADTDIGIVSA